MDQKLFSTLSGFKPASRKHRLADDDFVDRINRFLTPIIISIFSIIICAKQYVVGQPLQCWVPKEFSGAWEQYAENYCWVQNTYYVPPQESLPKHTEEREKKELNYYQWVPFVLALQAGCFLIVPVIWKLTNSASGIRIKSLVKAATDASNQGIEERQKGVAGLARHILMSLGHDLKSKFSPYENLRFTRKGLWAKTGWYVCSLYILVKLLYLLNIFCQFVILQSFLETKYTLYGIQILKDLVQGKEWMETGHFPRVTMCDFEVRALGQPRKYSLQCVLVINLFNEKIFIFLWFWFAFVGILTIISLITWLFWCILPMWRKRGVDKCLQDDEFKQNFKEKFLNDVLRADGQFLLKMIGVNVGEPIMFDIVNAMWHELTPQLEPKAIESKEGESSKPEDDDDDEEGDMKKRPIDDPITPSSFDVED